jgi:hypothetical protein
MGDTLVKGVPGNKLKNIDSTPSPFMAGAWDQWK